MSYPSAGCMGLPPDALCEYQSCYTMARADLALANLERGGLIPNLSNIKLRKRPRPPRGPLAGCQNSQRLSVENPVGPVTKYPFIRVLSRRKINKILENYLFLKK